MDMDESDRNFEQKSSSDDEDHNIDFNQEFATHKFSVSELPSGKFSSPDELTYRGVKTKGSEAAGRQKGQKGLEENLQALRDILPGSSSIGTSAVMADAFKYIDKLRGRVGELAAELKIDLHAEKPQLHGFALPDAICLHHHRNAIEPLVQVIAEEAGMRIHVCCVKRPGLLAATLEALENVGVNVINANVVSDAEFIFDAVGTDQYGGHAKGIDCEDVKNNILQTIKAQSVLH